MTTVVENEIDYDAWKVKSDRLETLRKDDLSAHISKLDRLREYNEASSIADKAHSKFLKARSELDRIETPEFTKNIIRWQRQEAERDEMVEEIKMISVGWFGVPGKENPDAKIHLVKNRDRLMCGSKVRSESEYQWCGNGFGPGIRLKADDVRLSLLECEHCIGIAQKLIKKREILINVGR